MSGIACHKDLIVWKKAVEMANKVYAATRQLPSDERFGLLTQLRRSALSVPSNIAEGSARRTRAEFLQFLHIARGSLAELETQMTIAVDQGLIAGHDAALEQIAEVGRMLNGLISSTQNANRAAHARACRSPLRTNR